MEHLCFHKLAQSDQSTRSTDVNLSDRPVADSAHDTLHRTLSEFSVTKGWFSFDFPENSNSDFRTFRVECDSANTDSGMYSMGSKVVAVPGIVNLKTFVSTLSPDWNRTHTPDSIRPDAMLMLNLEWMLNSIDWPDMAVAVY